MAFFLPLWAFVHFGLFLGLSLGLQACSRVFLRLPNFIISPSPRFETRWRGLPPAGFEQVGRLRN